MDLDLPAALAGLGLGLSLIVAIGAQNAFVLRQGLLGRHVLPVVGVCAVSDAVLIVVGVAGLGSLVERAPAVLVVTRLGGAAFLLAYGVLAARRALHPPAPSGLDAATAARGAPALAVVATALALTWLNPHVYLDTVVLLGSVAATHGTSRWDFAAGAVTASVLWFAGLGFGARLLRPLFVRPGTWRVLDAVIACVMLALAAMLLGGA